MNTLISRCATLLLLIAGCLVSAADGGVTVTADVAYKTGAELSDYEKARCKLDVYAPANAAPGPTRSSNGGSDQVAL